MSGFNGVINTESNHVDYGDPTYTWCQELYFLLYLVNIFQ